MYDFLSFRDICVGQRHTRLLLLCCLPNRTTAVVHGRLLLLCVGHVTDHLACHDGCEHAPGGNSKRILRKRSTSNPTSLTETYAEVFNTGILRGKLQTHIPECCCCCLTLTVPVSAQYLLMSLLVHIKLSRRRHYVLLLHPP
ncbi:unnamed protein product [Ectocarpus sp. 13 AM-2016]